MSRAAWLRRRLPRTVTGQITAVVLGTTLLVHLAAVTVIWTIGGPTPFGPSPELFTEISVLAPILARTPAGERGALLAGLRHVRIGACPAARVPPEETAGRPDTAIVRDRDRAPALALRLPDGVCVLVGPDAEDDSSPTGRRLSLGFWASLFGPVIVVALSLGVWATRRLTAPLGRLAAAADRLGREGAAPPLAEDGAVEIRTAAHAFNVMQERLRRSLDDRTRMLAAISHDLRTLITRLQLRAETVTPDATRDGMIRDLGIMTAMVGSTLAYVRGAEALDAAEIVDLAGLIETLCAEFTDIGHDVGYDGPSTHPFRCRPQTLGRALRNLIDNAVTHGAVKPGAARDGARVRIGLAAGTGRDAPAGVTITVEDEGPGIPEADRARVFEPFTRLDGARTVSTGGVGLGLALARTIIHAHGGDIRLSGGGAGGLRVTVWLPTV